MSGGHVDPFWRDDLMAIADATREPTHPDFAIAHIPHPSHAAEFTNLALELTINAWAPEVIADLPIALVPTDHDQCTACGETLCGCETQCDEFQRDVCSHWGKPFCASCAPHNCVECRDDQERWDRR